VDHLYCIGNSGKNDPLQNIHAFSLLQYFINLSHLAFGSFLQCLSVSYYYVRTKTCQNFVIALTVSKLDVGFVAGRRAVGAVND